ncbi:MAG: DUF488 domain-containing protein [Nanoarchaeota archaeon]|nr:DUF488 domain-containing protein [Nanoarchaeota archaeon]
MKKVYLIGHGNKKLQGFTGQLKGKNVNALIDIRSVPYSRFAFQFNRENLKKHLEREGIEYIYMGDLLGGKRKEGFENYMKSEAFKEAISKLKEQAEKANSAIMCAETDHAKCHRRFIGAELKEYDVENIGSIKRI